MEQNQENNEQPANPVSTSLKDMIKQNDLLLALLTVAEIYAFTYFKLLVFAGLNLGMIVLLYRMKKTHK